MLDFIYQALMQFLFPTHCPSCQAYTEKLGQWCPDCLTNIIRCENLSYDADIREYISPIIAIGKYDKGLKDLIHELKYHEQYMSLAYFPPLFEKLDQEWDFSSYDMIIPVPLHRNKLKQRGFNQVEKIFNPWIKQHHFHYYDILERTRMTKSQYQLHPDERRLNLADAFTLKSGATVNSCKCLLIDDIFTTGSTLKNCAMVLHEHGATSVGGLVLASQANIT